MTRTQITSAIFLLMNALSATPPAYAVTLSDLRCIAGQIPKRVNGAWRCRPDRTERWLVDASGKPIAPIVGDSPIAERVQIVRRIVDGGGISRNVRLLAGPSGFYHYGQDTIQLFFEGVDCTGSAWLKKEDLPTRDTFGSMGELGVPVALEPANSNAQRLYLRVPGQTESTGASVLSYAQFLPSPWAGDGDGWRCHNTGASGFDGIKFEMVSPNMNANLTFPLDVKIIP
jgi:hypothetical protein